MLCDATDMPKQQQWILSRNKMDTMANTSCARVKWTPVCFTGDTINVPPFAPEHCDSIKEVPIATCGTIVTTQTRKEWLVVRHKMLHFGEKMETA